MIEMTRLCAFLMAFILISGCKKSLIQNQPKIFSSSSTGSHSDSEVPAPVSNNRNEYDFHFLHNPYGLQYAWNADFDADGRADSLFLVIPNNTAFCSHGISCSNPWSQEIKNKMVLSEPGLLIKLDKHFSFFLQDSGFFENPETSKNEYEMKIEDRFRIIHPNDSTYSDWHARVVLKGDVIGVFENAGIETILFFNGKTFKLAYSDEEP